MENDNMYNVNIYYSEEEVHEAFKTYYNEVKQHSKVHIFTKNALPLSFYGDENNVALHSTGSLWDKLKAWMAREKPFQQQFLLLNIPKEKSERYLSLINNGGTIIISTQDELNDHPLKASNEINDSTVEGEVPPLPTTISNDVIVTASNNDNSLLELQSDDTEIEIKVATDTLNQSYTHVLEDLNDIQVKESTELKDLSIVTSSDLDVKNKVNENQEIDMTDNSGELDKASEELLVQSKEPSSIDNSIQTHAQEQNLYIADVSTSTQVPFTNDQQYEYYEDGPRKHNLYSENLKKLSSAHEDNVLNATVNNEDPFDVSTNQEPIAHVPDEPSDPQEFVSSEMNQVPSSLQQLQNIVQQAQQFYGFDDKQPQINELLDLVLQLSPDEVMGMVNVISSNVSTDSTESVLDFDLLAKLGGHGEADELKFSIEQALEKEIIITPDEQNDLSVDPTVENTDAELLRQAGSPEATPEHNRHDSP